MDEDRKAMLEELQMLTEIYIKLAPNSYDVCGCQATESLGRQILLLTQKLEHPLTKAEEMEYAGSSPKHA